MRGEALVLVPVGKIQVATVARRDFEEEADKIPSETPKQLAFPIVSGVRANNEEPSEVRNAVKRINR